MHALIPTRDSMAVVPTILRAAAIHALLGVEGGLTYTELGNIPRARNALAHDLRRTLGRDRAWVLWVDSDILLPEDPGLLLDAIRWSWRTGLAWTAHYAMTDGRSHMMRGRGLDPQVAANFTAAEVAELEEWHPIPQCGFGCLFLPMDLTYEFRSNTAGEDVLYWMDHPDDHAHFAKAVRLRHRKSGWV